MTTTEDKLRRALLGAVAQLKNIHAQFGGDELWHDIKTCEQALAGTQPGREVHITASDYQYDGWLVGVIEKRSGQLRGIVEDSNGRLFIHNAGQLNISVPELTSLRSAPPSVTTRKGDAL